MANKQGDVDLRFAQVSAPSYHFGFAWLELLLCVGWLSPLFEFMKQWLHKRRQLELRRWGITQKVTNYEMFIYYKL